MASESSTIIVRNNTIYTNKTGIFVEDSSPNIIKLTNNTIRSTRLSFTDAVIAVNDISQSSVEITQNIVQNVLRGIAFTNSTPSSLLISENRISAYRQNLEIYNLSQSSFINITNNQFTGLTETSGTIYGVEVSVVKDVRDFTITDNLINSQYQAVRFTQFTNNSFAFERNIILNSYNGFSSNNFESTDIFINGNNVTHDLYHTSKTAFNILNTNNSEFQFNDNFINTEIGSIFHELRYSEFFHNNNTYTTTARALLVQATLNTTLSFQDNTIVGEVGILAQLLVNSSVFIQSNTFMAKNALEALSFYFTNFYLNDNTLEHSASTDVNSAGIKLRNFLNSSTLIQNTNVKYFAIGIDVAEYTHGLISISSATVESTQTAFLFESLKSVEVTLNSSDLTAQNYGIKYSQFSILRIDLFARNLTVSARNPVWFSGFSGTLAITDSTFVGDNSANSVGIKIASFNSGEFQIDSNSISKTNVAIKLTQIDANFVLAYNFVDESTTGFELMSINTDSNIIGNRIYNPETGIRLFGQATHNFFLESNQIFNSTIAIDAFNINGYFGFKNNTVYARDDALQFNQLLGNASLVQNFINSREKAIKVTGTFSNTFSLEQNTIIAKYGLYFPNQVSGLITFFSGNSLNVTETGIYIGALVQGTLLINDLQVIQAQVAVTVSSSNAGYIEFRNTSLNSTEYAFSMQTAENSVLVFENTNFNSTVFIFRIDSTDALFSDNVFSAEDTNLQFVIISATSSVNISGNTFYSGTENLYINTLSGQLLVAENLFLNAGSTALQFDSVAGELKLLSNTVNTLGSRIDVKDSYNANIEITRNTFHTGTSLSVNLRVSSLLNVTDNFVDKVEFTIQPSTTFIFEENYFSNSNMLAFSVDKLAILNTTTLELRIDGTLKELGLTFTDTHILSGDYLASLNGGFAAFKAWTLDQEITFNLNSLINGNGGKLDFTFYTVFPNYVVYNLTFLNVPLVVLQDNTLPTFLFQPPDETYVFFAGDSQSETISWTFTDVNPDDYVIFTVPGIFYLTGTWVSPTTIEVVVNETILSIGRNEFFIRVFDKFGNRNLDRGIVFNFFNDVPEVVQKPNNATVEAGSSFFLIWTASDHNLTSYEIFKNGVSHATQTYESNQFLNLSFSTETVNIFNYTIVFIDAANNVATHTVFITVQDTTSPEITLAPTQASLEAGSPLVWKAVDVLLERVILYENSVVVFNETWVSNNELSLSTVSRALGSYNYTVVFIDTSGNQRVQKQTVLLIDTTLPVFVTKPASTLTFFEGNLTSLQWKVSDLFPDRYTLYFDGNLLLNTTWMSSDSVEFSLPSGLEPGSYNYTVVFFDSSGNFAKNEVLVTVVQPTTSPSTTPSSTTPPSTTPPSTTLTSISVTDTNTLLLIGLATVSSLVIIGGGGGYLYSRRRKGLKKRSMPLKKNEMS